MLPPRDSAYPTDLTFILNFMVFNVQTLSDPENIQTLFQSSVSLTYGELSQQKKQPDDTTENENDGKHLTLS